jgi:hypothetical protein
MRIVIVRREENVHPHTLRSAKQTLDIVRCIVLLKAPLNQRIRLAAWRQEVVVKIGER